MKVLTFQKPCNQEVGADLRTKVQIYEEFGGLQIEIRFCPR